MMHRTETLQKVQGVIYEQTGEWATPEARLVSLVTDSLEMASLVLELEAVTGKTIPDEELQKLFTVQDIVNYAEAH